VQSNAFNHQYNVWFEEAYSAHPRLPKGLLEAIAYTNNRIHHLDAENRIESCTCMPLTYGIMGLVENGKGWFKTTLHSVAEVSGQDPDYLKRNYIVEIEAYAAWIESLAVQNHLDLTHVEALAYLIRISSEIPMPAKNWEKDFALNSYLYSVLYFMNNPAFQQAFHTPPYHFDMQSLFGTEYSMVTASHLDISSEIKGDAPEPMNGAFKALCSMPTGPKEYAAAITFDAPDPANYSTTAITPYTIAIHDIEGTYASCISWFNNLAAGVSAHYVMRSFDGQVTQMVCHRTKAYHVAAENSYAVGIEHEGFAAQGEVWYTNALYQSSANLCKFIAADLSINSLQTYDGPPVSGLMPLSHTCTKIKGHQMFPNNSHSDPGPGWDWPRFYQLINDVMPTPLVSTTASGSIYDSGGSAANYGNEERSTWRIQPTGGAGSITLSFSNWAVENTYDFLWIYDGINQNGALIGKYSGTSPGTVTAYSGAIFMEFRSDCATTASGWAASYSSSTASCTIPSGLMATPTALSSSLAWNAVAGVPSYEIAIKRTTATLWTNYTVGTNNYIATGLTAGALYEWKVRSVCAAGTYSGYSGTTFITNDIPSTLAGTGSITVNQCTGNFLDSGGADWNYGHYESCTYIISPPGASAVMMSFSSFNIEANYDYLYIYNGPSTSSPLIGTYTGTASPGTVTESSGTMTLRFTSDNATYAAGWNSSWTCTQSCNSTSLVNAITGWKTDDFTAGFTNQICSNPYSRYYNVQGYTGTEWRSSIANGFFNDEFATASINANWTVSTGTWSINAGALYQADEATGSGDNTNIYASLTQNNAQAYLYTWDDKISGTGTNRRAGIHWFCDNPTLSNRGNSYFIYYRIDSDKMQLYKVSSNVYTLVLDIAVTVDPDIWYSHKVIYNPATGKIDIYRNNSFIATWTDSAPLTSGIAISPRSGNSKYYIDNLKVYKWRGTDNVTVTVGPASNEMVNYQSASTTADAGRITALLLDNTTWTNPDTKSFKVDYTAPQTGIVNDGTGADIDLSTTATSLSANWSNFADSHSGITAYEYAVGTSAGGTNFIGWTSNGTNTSITINNLHLAYGQMYYISLRATNGAGLSAMSSSDGILLPCNSTWGISVAGITTNAATVSWNAVTGATGYNVQYRASGATVWTTISASTNSLGLSNLSPSTLYEVQVSTSCVAGSSGYSSPVNFTTLSPCDVPGGIVVSGINTSSATVTWTAVNNATSYSVLFRPVGASSWTTISSLTNTASLTSLTSSTAYEVMLSASCSTGTSSFSAAVNFTTLSPCGIPTALTITNVLAASATISWAAVSGATSYKVQYRKTGVSGWTSVTSTTTSKTLSSLTGSTEYQVRVAAYCSSGWSSYTAISTFTTMAPCGVPTGLFTDNISTTSAKLNWTAVAGITYYKVKFRKTGTTIWTIYSVTTPYKIVSSLLACTSYEWQLYTTCPSGTSALTGIVSFTTAGCPGKGEDTDVTMQKNNETLRINPNPVDDKAEVIYQCKTGGDAVIRIFTLDGKIVKEQSVKLAVGENRIILDLSKVARGCYFISVRSGIDKSVVKFNVL